MVAFGGMGVFLVPFLKVYTNGINDGVNYIRPLFEILMTLAYGIQSIRDPYDKLILASGHFKETQSSYIIAACLNLGISLIAVKYWGLEGVVIGTLAAMAYQMIYMAVYDTKVLLKRSGWIFVKWIFIDAVLLILIIILAELLKAPFEKIIYFILEFL